MKKTLVAIAACAAFSMSAVASADNLAATLHGGTTGIGLGLTYGVTDTVNVRGIYNRFNYSTSETIDDYKYDLDLKMSTAELLADWHVFNGSFRLTGGLVYNGNTLGGKGVPTSAGSVEFGGQIFNATDIGNVRADVDFRRYVPYLGIGWGNSLKGGRLGLYGDLGVQFQGKPSTSVRAVAAEGAPAMVQNALNEAIAVEEQELKDKVDNFRYYPVARVGISYRF